MDELEQEINFNNPITITEIFRVAGVEGRQLPPQAIEGVDEITEYEEPKAEVLQVVNEYAFLTSFGWEDVRGLGQHPYPDNWAKLKGPKFNIQLATRTNELLVLGKYEEMLKQWTAFRNKYPLFKEED